MPWENSWDSTEKLGLSYCYNHIKGAVGLRRLTEDKDGLWDLSW